MSLKDEVKFVKDELTSDEKILESAFRAERLYKKHKIKIFAIVAILVLFFGGNAIVTALNNATLAKANEAFLTLQKNPKDAQALSQLQESNPKLYNLYVYAEAVKNKDTKQLAAMNANDPLLVDLGAYQAAVLQNKTKDSRYYHELVLVEEAYAALKSGNKALARQKLALIPKKSPVSDVARLLRHYTITVK